MKNHLSTTTFAFVATSAALAIALPATARADAVTDWNHRTQGFINEARLGTPPAIRIVALVQTAAAEAVTAAGRQAPEAALAAAHRAMLLKLLPGQAAAIEAAFQATLTALPDNTARAQALAVGERAAAAVLARRADDGAAAPEAYRPLTAPGTYVPTVVPAVTQWPQRRPWLMASPSALRPSAPPALNSPQWERDFNEVKALGGKASSQRSAEQTEVARFWDYSQPAVYFGIARSVANQPGRDLAANAQLFATVAQAMDDAMIAVFDAKYAYSFWRPVTAIRNADQDGHPATERDPHWAPLIDVPMHPEYPSGHSILAAAVATVLKHELDGRAVPMLTTTSPTAGGASPAQPTTRRWSDLDSFVREVSDARIWGGLHFRSATDVGEAMGRRIGELAARQLMAAK